jgi:phosphotransacetylase
MPFRDLQGDLGAILVINCGSSSVKFELFGGKQPLSRLWSGSVDRIGIADTRLHIVDDHGRTVVDRVDPLAGHEEALAQVLGLIEQRGPDIDQARTYEPCRVVVADAAQGVLLETLREAHALGFVEPRLVGDPDRITSLCKDAGWEMPKDWIVPAETDAAMAIKAVELVRKGGADAVMKGHIHTDALMHALLDKDHGLRVPGRRVSHVFVVEVPSRSKLLGITDAAINIAPDLNAKAEILQNAIEFFHLLGIELPKVAVLSAVETVNPAIASTLDAACLTLMAQRRQIAGAIVDGPLAFDNAISRNAAQEKGISSEVAGNDGADALSSVTSLAPVEPVGSGLRRGRELPHRVGRAVVRHGVPRSRGRLGRPA